VPFRNPELLSAISGTVVNQLRGLPGTEQETIHPAQNDQQSSPPNRCVEVSDTAYLAGRIRPFRQAAHKDQNSVDEQQQSYEEPNRDDVMFFRHCPLPEDDLQNH